MTDAVDRVLDAKLPSDGEVRFAATTSDTYMVLPDGYPARRIAFVRRVTIPL